MESARWEWSLQSVLRTFVRDYDHDAVVITVNGDEITSTQLHPFWVMDGSELDHRPVREHLYAPPEHSKLAGRWVDAVDLRPGDTVFLQTTGPARIEAVRTEPANYPVYNFSVDGLKCYTVGRNSVLVHNSNGVELPGPGKAPVPKLKDSDFGPKIADRIPADGVPSNWNKEMIEDAIVDYQSSIASRKAEQAAFALAGTGSEIERLAHARRIADEERFLAFLRHALENRR